MAAEEELWLVCCGSFTQHFLPLQIKYHEEFEKSRMGPSGGEGLEPERRDPQDTGYRRPQEQQPHHIPTSAPGEREACVGRGPEARPATGLGGGEREASRTHTHPGLIPTEGTSTGVRARSGLPAPWGEMQPLLQNSQHRQMCTQRQKPLSSMAVE